MDGDYLFDCLKNIAFSGGHECDECPARSIVGVSCGFSCKLVLEEVGERSELGEEFWSWRANSCTSSIIIILIIITVGSGGDET